MGFTEEPKEEKTGHDRRELIQKIGKFGAYTAPALLVLLSSTKYAQSADSVKP